MSEHMRCAQPGCGAQIACVLCGEPVAAPASGEPSGANPRVCDACGCETVVIECLRCHARRPHGEPSGAGTRQDDRRRLWGAIDRYGSLYFDTVDHGDRCREARNALAKLIDELLPSGSGAEAVVREAKATPLSDAAVAWIIEAVEKHCGMGHGAWDMVAARDLAEGFAAVFGADTRRVDALEARGCVELVQNIDGTWDIDPDPDLHARFPSLRAAIDSVLLPTAPGAPEEGAGE